MITAALVIATIPPLVLLGLLLERRGWLGDTDKVLGCCVGLIVLAAGAERFWRHIRGVCQASGFPDPGVSP